MRGSTRVALVTSSALALAVAAAIPGGAQPTTVTTITYATTAASSGITFAITPPGSTTPAAGVFGAATTAEVNSDGPSAKGTADALAALTQSPVTASSEAPPDEPEATAGSPVPAIVIPNVATVAPLQGTASSVSEAEDESPSASSTATFGALDISLAALPALPVLGTVGGSIRVAQMQTRSEAQAPRPTNVGANASSEGVVISADLDISGLGAVCGLIPVPQLQDACNSLATPSQLINITAGPSNVECAWDGSNADCEGAAATATVTLAGQAPQTVAPGQSVTIPNADPFLVRVRAGSFEETVEGDEGSAISAGLSIELIGQTRANPGLITLAVGQSTAGVNGEITRERTTAPTGGGLLPFFFGGSALAFLGFGLRRYLKRS